MVFLFTEVSKWYAGFNLFWQFKTDVVQEICMNQFKLGKSTSTEYAKYVKQIFVQHMYKVLK